MKRKKTAANLASVELDLTIYSDHCQCCCYHGHCDRYDDEAE